MAFLPPCPGAHRTRATHQDHGELDLNFAHKSFKLDAGIDVTISVGPVRDDYGCV